MGFSELIKESFTQYAAQADKDFFFDIRNEAFNFFNENGMPTTKNEEWKYTNTRKISEASLNFTCVNETNAQELLEGSLLNEIVAHKLVFINGSYYPNLSVFLEEEAEVVVTVLSLARKQYPEVLKAHFGKYAKINEGLNAANTALLSDGAFIYVPKGKKMRHPVILQNIVDASEMAVVQQPRNLVVLEKDASATIIESYIGKGNNLSFTNVVNEIFVDDNGQLEHYKVQRATGETYQNNYTQIHQNGHTNINQVTLTLEGQWVRNNLHFYMNGEHSNSLLYGLYITHGNQFVDNHSRVDHAMPNCMSDEKYKGILMDQSIGVFNGKIKVHLDAQKTNAYQRNQNILLSDSATVNTKPQLEIFADDVKCTHGATIGQLDEEPMFYLRSRGIPEDAARKLLLNAFADDIAEKIKIPELVQILEAEIERKL